MSAQLFTFTYSVNDLKQCQFKKVFLDAYVTDNLFPLSLFSIY